VGYTFISGNLALDLTGTVGHRKTVPVELLTRPENLETWLAEAGLLFPDTVITEDDFAAALRLREAVYDIATAAGAEYPPGARSVINDLAAAAPPLLAIAPDGSLRRRGGATAAISLLARAAVELLTSDAVRQIRECAGEECTRLYVDNSSRGARRWCDMRLCGNRAKVASFRTRHP
jgi:predicted RNA-binding Zn ribbon-like protein